MQIHSRRVIALAAALALTAPAAASAHPARYIRARDAATAIHFAPAVKRGDIARAASTVRGRKWIVTRLAR